MQIDTTSSLTELLTEALRLAIGDEPHDGALAASIARALMRAGADIDIESDEPDEEDLSADDLPRSAAIATTQTHRLTVDGEEVAVLEREGMSHYGSPDHPDTPSGEWTTDSGENDEQPSAAWEAVAGEADLGDEWDYVPGAAEPEAPEPETDAEGEYRLWWGTVGDDSGPVGDRYATLADAEAACESAELDLRTHHRGHLLCGYGIARLVDGQWVELEADHDGRHVESAAD